LTESGVWDSFSDGIVNDTEAWSSEDRYTLRGWIYHIDQSLHPFWLELARDKQGGVSWFVGLDFVASSPQHARSVFDGAQRFEDVEWQFELAGEATIEAGRLDLVAGSIRSRARSRAARARSRRPSPTTSSTLNRAAD
jgi:hypothetical protein